MMKIKLVLFMAAYLLLCSCEEPIDIALKNKGGNMVIEGVVGDILPAYVIVSRSTDFKDTTLLKTVVADVVTVTDGSGKTDTFQRDNSTGFYFALGLQPQVGQSYTLSVTAEGKTYTSVCAVNGPVPIDSIYSTKSSFSDEDRLMVDFRDPAGIPNYYKAMIFVNKQWRTGNFLSDDNLTDGKDKTLRINVGDFASGDTIDVFLQSLDKSAYEYFTSIESNSGQNAAPTNPISNISGGSMGYFSTYTSSTKQFIFP
jgi:hypothetical protein